MTEFDLLEIIGEADDQYIMESRKRPRKKSQKNRWLYAVAACLALAVMGGAWAVTMQNGVRSQNAAAQAALDTAEEAALWDTAPAEAPAEEAGEAEMAVETAEDAPPVPMPENGGPDLGSYGSVVPLANAEYPSSAGHEDYETASSVWRENQTADETKTALNSFSYRTAALLLRDTADSGCYSPLSLYQTLSILASGAEGQTRDQLLDLLGQGDVGTLEQESGKLYRVNYADDGVSRLQIANSLWLDSTGADGSPVDFHQQWVLSAARNFYTDVYAAEFDDPDTALALGDWIARRTGGLLHPSPQALDLPSETVMAIVNTLWYESPWAEAFEASDTAPDTFTGEDGTESTRDFMHRTQEGVVIQTSRYTKSYLPMDRGRMIFVLPQEGVALDSLLEEETLWEIFENGDYTEAEVSWSIPKFETNADYDLKDVLVELGVTDAFDSQTADFSPISATPLVLGKIQQGTHLTLDETGVEAAAYTMAGMEAAGAPAEEPPKVEMDLDRPFLYLITSLDGSALFLGTVR